jgi:hypothetical protein
MSKRLSGVARTPKTPKRPKAVLAPEPSPSPEVEEQEADVESDDGSWSSFTVDQLRKCLKILGKDSNGRKDTLIDRLLTLKGQRESLVNPGEAASSRISLTRDEILHTIETGITNAIGSIQCDSCKLKLANQVDAKHSSHVPVPNCDEPITPHIAFPAIVPTDAQPANPVEPVPTNQVDTGASGDVLPVLQTHVEQFVLLKPYTLE